MNGEAAVIIVLATILTHCAETKRQTLTRNSNARNRRLQGVSVCGCPGLSEALHDNSTFTLKLTTRAVAYFVTLQVAATPRLLAAHCQTRYAITEKQLLALTLGLYKNS